MPEVTHETWPGRAKSMTWNEGDAVKTKRTDHILTGYLGAKPWWEIVHLYLTARSLTEFSHGKIFEVVEEHYKPLEVPALARAIKPTYLDYWVCVTGFEGPGLLIVHMSQLESQYRFHGHWLREFRIGNRTSVSSVHDHGTYDLRGRYITSFRVLVYGPQRIRGGDWESPDFRIAESAEYPGGPPIQADFAQRSTAQSFQSALLEMGANSWG